MELSPPKNITFYAGVILWVMGLIAPYLPFLKNFPIQGLGSGFVFAILGGLVLILGNVLKNF